MNRIFYQLALIILFTILVVTDAFALGCTPHVMPYDAKRFIPRIFQIVSIQASVAHLVVLASLIIYRIWPLPKPPSAKFVAYIFATCTFGWICWQFFVETFFSPEKGYCIPMPDWQKYPEKFSLYLLVAGVCYTMYKIALFIPDKHQRKTQIIAIVILFATIPMPM